MSEEEVTYDKVKAARDELKTAKDELKTANDSHTKANNKYWEDLGFNYFLNEDTEDGTNYWDSNENVEKFVESYDPFNFNFKKIR